MSTMALLASFRDGVSLSQQEDYFEQLPALSASVEARCLNETITTNRDDGVFPFSQALNLLSRARDVFDSNGTEIRLLDMENWFDPDGLLTIESRRCIVWKVFSPQSVWLAGGQYESGDLWAEAVQPGISLAGQVQEQTTSVEPMSFSPSLATYEASTPSNASEIGPGSTTMVEAVSSSASPSAVEEESTSGVASESDNTPIAMEPMTFPAFSPGEESTSRDISESSRQC
ncbi:hypothetical protein BT63DRAFT_471752 [Microthyrium microscopicum]|uniref:Uncharacterized protein n=1 Tax=Microthyrium microscopicum TaxID=703497 RepID=A0A6A6UAP8_9PEZI|nr:hypothetical protein BT63DRAFT_471752 [Microthyrium microscopicum]